LGLQLENLLAPVPQGGWASQPDTTALGSPEASVDSFPDQAAFKFGYGHEDTQLKPPCWVVTAGVDALRGADQRDAQPLKLIEDQSQVRQRSAKPVQFVHDHPGHLAGPHLAHHGVELWPCDLGTRLMLDEEPDF